MMTTHFTPNLGTHEWVVFGDTHAQMAAFLEVCLYAVATGRRGLLSVGDFGFLPALPEGRAFIAYVAELLEAYDLYLLVVDGNHDDQDALLGLQLDETGMGIIGPRARHARRGTHWEISGVSFLAAGGAVSIDQHRRTQGVDWWENEALGYSDVNRCIDGGHADVIIAHDTPAGVAGDDVHVAYTKMDEASAANRRALLAIVEAVKPSVLYHGHYHVRRTAFLTLENGQDVRIEGLGRDGQGDRLYTGLEL
jgi:hypothetical protein